VVLGIREALLVIRLQLEVAADGVVEGMPDA
jgi:hypothetical protein